MKITVDIHDELLAQAKQHAEDTGRTLCSVIEDGLRQTLPAHTPEPPYKLADLRVGDPGAQDPLEGYSWPQLREEITATPGRHDLGAVNRTVRWVAWLVVWVVAAVWVPVWALLLFSLLAWLALDALHRAWDAADDRDFSMFPELPTRDPT